MIKQLNLWSISLIIVIAGGCNSLKEKPYGYNPALNPVEFKNPEKHNPLILIKGRKADFAIVYDTLSEKDVDKNRKSVHLAANALKQAFKKTVGINVTEIDVRDTQKIDGYTYCIYLGKSPVTDKLGIDITKLPKEGFVIKTFSKGVVIAGCDGSLIPGTYTELDNVGVARGVYKINGTLWGVYDFIERFLGVRYYFPGIGVHIPAVTDLIINPVFYTDHPVLKSYRQGWDFWRGFGRTGEKWPWDKKKFPPDYNKFGDYWRIGNSTRFWITHTPHGKKWAKIHKDKPELFYRSPDGMLFMNAKGRHEDNIMDISRKETAVQYIKDCEKFYQTGWSEPWGAYTPNEDYIPFGQSDVGTYIINERTKGLMNYSEPRRTMSDVNARFYIWLAEIAQKRLPDKRVIGWSYSSWNLPPKKKWEFPSNLDWHCCQGVAASFYASKNIRGKYINLLKWWYTALDQRKVGAGFYFSDKSGLNCLGGIRGLPQFFKEARTYMCSAQNWCSLMPWGKSYFVYYVFHRLHWDPEFDAEAALEEHYALLYGGAANDIRSFYTIIMDKWDEYLKKDKKIVNYDPVKRGLGIDPDIFFKEVYGKESLTKLQRLLTQARAAVKHDSIEAKRIDFITKAWERDLEKAKAYISVTLPATRVKFVKEAVRIDGKLEDAFWNKAYSFTFKNVKTAEKVQFNATGRLLWDKENIYLAFEFEDNNIKGIQANAKKRDDAAWADDSVEIFLSPGHEKKRCYQLAINSKAVLYDSFQDLTDYARAEVGWNCNGIKKETSVEKNKWILEAQIPFESLNAVTPEEDSIWYVNFIRNKKTQPKETSSFSITMGNNQNVKYFGKIKFVR